MFSITKPGLRTTARTGLGAAAAVLALGTLAVSTAGPASAEIADCPAEGAVCMWDNVGWTGSASIAMVGNLESGFCVDVVSLNDRTSSIVNNSGRELTFYLDSGCQGTSFVSPPRSAHYNVGYDDQISSFRIGQS